MSGQYYVGMVPIPFFPAIAPYIPDLVVDRGCDTPVESYIVHLLIVDRIEHNYYKERMALFLIFLCNIYVRRYKLI